MSAPSAVVTSVGLGLGLGLLSRANVPI